MMSDLQTNTLIPLAAGRYFEQEFKKNLLVLHYTAGGSAESSIRWWNRSVKPNEGIPRIGTSYVVDRDGTIYETFPPEFWAYHLGVGSPYEHDKRSIGIEIANWGWLNPQGTRLFTYMGKDFCGFGEKQKFVQSPEPYRGKRFWEAFPAAQVQAVAALTRHLCDRFQIPFTIHPDALAGNCNPSIARKYRGILTHTTFRNDKWDVGPAFPWAQLIEPERNMQ